ncbi:LysR family transcriptional regulator [Agreia bicolorata]|uniref:LysR family transcriptional regulator n=1 Tax=Agreia bicolorata TaxID=110935 RepID=UPI0005CA648D|nr:LysR family transcriptional regulator [Agreia bicolorata]
MSASNITLRQLRTFLAVAELQSFSGAAQELRVSNPWVSESIKELEKQLGVVLFVRTTRSVELTKAGAILKEMVGHALIDLDTAFGVAQRTGAASNSGLTLGYAIGAGLEVVPWLLRSFATQHPQRELSTVEFDFTDPTAGLRDHSVDAAIIRPPVGLTGLTSLELIAEARVACLPEGHRLAAEETVTVADILDEPIIAAPNAPGPWRDYWLLSDYRSEPANVVGEASTRDGELHLVARGAGISVTSAGAGRWYSRPGVVFRPIRDIPPCTVVLAWWPESTPRVSDLIGIAKDFGRTESVAGFIDSSVPPTF